VLPDGSTFFFVAWKIAWALSFVRGAFGKYGVDGWQIDRETDVPPGR